MFMKINTFVFLTILMKILLFCQNVNVKVDPRIELITIVQIIGDYGTETGLLTEFDFGYKEDVLKYFGRFRNHDAVKTINKIWKKGFNFDVPHLVMIHYSNPPELKKLADVPERALKRSGGREKLDNLIGQLKDFAVKSGFKTFYEKRADYFRGIEQSVKNKMENIDYVKTLEDYFQMRQKSYNIILALLSNPGGYGVSVKDKSGMLDIFNITGPNNVTDNIPEFGSVKYFRHLCWHEFGHSFVNPLTAKNIKLVKKYSNLYKPIKEKMKKQAYGNWESTVNEHIIRAVTTRLTYLYIGETEGDKQLEWEKERGFIYIESLCEKLKKYESAKTDYSSFAEFYPELIKGFNIYMK